MEIIHFYDQKMVRGSIDLLIEKSNGDLLIVDYKTSTYSPLVNELSFDRDQDLADFCREKGYHHQLSVYKKAVSAMHPDKKIQSGIFLTKEREFILLDWV